MGQKETAVSPKIVMDLKKNRIRIHKQTLYLLGKPDYIELLINPQKMTLIILPSNREDHLAHTKPLQPYEIFVANIEAGNDKQLIIKGLVESYGLEIGDKPKANIICAVSTIEKIYDHYGYHILDQTLRLIVATWQGELRSFSSNMLLGVAKLVYAYGDQIKEDCFKEKLGQVSVKEISRTAKDRRSGSLGYAEAMLNLYNSRKGPRSCLSTTRLYQNKDIPKKMAEKKNDADEMDQQQTLWDQDMPD